MIERAGVTGLAALRRPATQRFGEKPGAMAASASSEQAGSGSGIRPPCRNRARPSGSATPPTTANSSATPRERFMSIARRNTRARARRFASTDPDNRREGMVLPPSSRTAVRAFGRAGPRHLEIGHTAPTCRRRSIPPLSGCLCRERTARARGGRLSHGQRPRRQVIRMASTLLRRS